MSRHFRFVCTIHGTYFNMYCLPILIVHCVRLHPFLFEHLCTYYSSSRHFECFDSPRCIPISFYSTVVYRFKFNPQLKCIEKVAVKKSHKYYAQVINDNCDYMCTWMTAQMDAILCLPQWNGCNLIVS